MDAADERQPTKKPALLMRIQGQLENALEGATVNLHQDMVDYWATIEYPLLGMSCTASIAGDSIFFETRGPKCPLWARAGVDDSAEQVSIIKRWISRR
jgi:hypothetical protein